MFKFNGGSGAIVCDACRTIVREAAAPPPGRYQDEVDLCRGCGSEEVPVRRDLLLEAGDFVGRSNRGGPVARGLLALAASPPRRGPSPCAVALVTDDRGWALLVQSQKRCAAAGRAVWEIPGGGVLPGETWEEAARREVREETGVHVASISIADVLYGTPRPGAEYPSVIVVARGVVGDEARCPAPGDDASDAGWFPPEGLPELADLDSARVVRAWVAEVLARARLSGSGGTADQGEACRRGHMDRLRHVLSAGRGLPVLSASEEESLRWAVGELEGGRLSSFLAMCDPWPTTDVLGRLADAADHLLDDYQCDGHGYEEARIAAVAARERLRRLSEEDGTCSERGPCWRCGAPMAGPWCSCRAEGCPGRVGEGRADVVGS